MSVLTPEQSQLIRESGGAPPRLVDPGTNRQYVLLEADAYDRLQSAFATDIDPRDLYPSLERTLQDEGWNDPHMDDYNRYA
jgi:hypothetical protein